MYLETKIARWAQDGKSIRKKMCSILLETTLHFKFFQVTSRARNLLFRVHREVILYVRTIWPVWHSCWESVTTNSVYVWRATFMIQKKCILPVISYVLTRFTLSICRIMWNVSVRTIAIISFSMTLAIVLMQVKLVTQVLCCRVNSWLVNELAAEILHELCYNYKEIIYRSEFTSSKNTSQTCRTSSSQFSDDLIHHSLKYLNWSECVIYCFTVPVQSRSPNQHHTSTYNSTNEAFFIYLFQDI